MSGKFQLKGRSTDTKIDGLDDLDVNGEDQYIPGQKRDVTYVSRLQVIVDTYLHFSRYRSKVASHSLVNFCRVNSITRSSFVY